MPKESKKYAILLSLLFASLFVSLVAQDRHPSSYRNLSSPDTVNSGDSTALPQIAPALSSDSIPPDSLSVDSLGTDSLATDTVPVKKKKAGLTSVVDYKANDSIVFTHGNEVYMYGKGVVQFDGMELLVLAPYSVMQTSMGEMPSACSSAPRPASSPWTSSRT